MNTRTRKPRTTAEPVVAENGTLQKEGEPSKPVPAPSLANPPPLTFEAAAADPMALALHRVVQVVRPVGSGNPTYGLIGQVGEIQDGYVWLYLIRERGAKEFMRVPIGDVAVIGKGRVCSDKPKPDDQTRALVERPAVEVEDE